MSGRRSVLVGFVAGVAVGALAVSGLRLTFGGAGDNFYAPAPGEIIFGTDLDPTFQMVRDKTMTARQDATIAFVAALPRLVAGRVDVTFSKDGGPSQAAGGITLSNPSNFYSGKYRPNAFPGPGHYVFTLSAGVEALATGELDVTR